MAKFFQSEQWSLFFNNPIFLSAITSWLLSQLIKTIVSLFSNTPKRFIDFVEVILWRTGGMPSSHSALASSLATSIGIRHGFDSDFFIFTVFFAMVVVRDAVGVRRSNGSQARTLNSLAAKFSEKNSEYSFKPVKEIQGHRPAEACAGIILGIIVAILFGYFG